MPVIISDATIAASYINQIETIAANWWVITNVTVYEPSRASSHPECYASIGLMEGGVAFTNVVSMLNGGLLGNTSLLGWNGKIKTGSGFYVFADLYGHTNQVYRLAVTYEETPHV